MAMEEKYVQRCTELKRRLKEVEEHNETISLSISRTRRMIQRARLERALLQERLEQATLTGRDVDAEDTPPPSPIVPASTTTRDGQSRGTKRLSTAVTGADASTVSNEGSSGAASKRRKAAAQKVTANVKQELPRDTKSKKGPSLKLTLSTRAKVPQFPMNAKELYLLDNPDGPDWDTMEFESKEPFIRAARGLKIKYSREIVSLPKHLFTRNQLAIRNRAQKALGAIEEAGIEDNDPAIDSKLAALDDSETDSLAEDGDFEDDTRDADDNDADDATEDEDGSVLGPSMTVDSVADSPERPLVSELYSETMSEGPSEIQSEPVSEPASEPASELDEPSERLDSEAPITEAADSHPEPEPAATTDAELEPIKESPETANSAADENAVKSPTTEPSVKEEPHTKTTSAS